MAPTRRCWKCTSAITGFICNTCFPARGERAAASDDIEDVIWSCLDGAPVEMYDRATPEIVAEGAVECFSRLRGWSPAAILPHVQSWLSCRG